MAWIEDADNHILAESHTHAKFDVFGAVSFAKRDAARARGQRDPRFARLFEWEGTGAKEPLILVRR